MTGKCNSCKYSRYLVEGYCKDCKKERHAARRREIMKGQKAAISAPLSITNENIPFTKAEIKSKINAYFEGRLTYEPTSFFKGLTLGLTHPSTISISELKK